VIDTHWHFDHTDNNAPLHAAGATILAHANTKKRMSETHDLPVLGLHFPASPADALPQQTFASNHKLQGNGETVLLQHFAPAHTDTDIYVRFEKANIIHMGDTFFNGFYPFIDSSTGGKITGMIAAADTIRPGGVPGALIPRLTSDCLVLWDSHELFQKGAERRPQPQLSTCLPKQFLGINGGFQGIAKVRQAHQPYGVRQILFASNAKCNPT
jgi:hypothetical protein